MFDVRVMDDLVSGWNNLSMRLVHKYSLKKEFCYLTLLFYQYSYLRNLIGDQSNDIRIINSYLEDNIHLCVVIVSKGDKDKTVKLERFVFQDDIYHKLEELYPDSINKGVNINYELLDTFSSLFLKYKI